MSKGKTDFGKDLGLVHEAICVGRKVGADQAFWSYLAQDEEIFQQVVQTVKAERAKWLTLSPSEAGMVSGWLARIFADNYCPFPEKETYYVASSHCEYDNYYHDLHFGAFRTIFRKASQSKAIETLCRLIEASFVVSYLLSGYYSAGQDPEGIAKKWMHGPFSISAYLRSIWEHTEAPLGKFFNHHDLRAISGLEKVYTLSLEDGGKAHITEIVKVLMQAQTDIILSAKAKLRTLPTTE